MFNKSKITYFVITLVGILLLLGGCSEYKSASKPKAQGGILDLTQGEFADNVIALDGEWEFYWGQFLTPGAGEKGTNGYIQVPGSWNKYLENSRQTGDGYGTYRLELLTKENARLALKIPRMFTAYEFWVNGELIATGGKVGETRETMTPQYLPQVAFFQAQAGSNEILIKVSNFYHRSGGMLENIQLGTEREILSLRYKALAREFFVFGSLMIIGIYHLALFFFRKKSIASLCFGLFCLLIGLRTFIVGERFFIFLFPDFSWEIAHKIQTLTYYLGVPFMLMYFRSVYPKYFHRRIIKLAQIIAVVFTLILLLTPARIFTALNPVYQIGTVLAIFYIAFALGRLTIAKEKGSILISFGALALLLTSLNDVIFHSIWLNDGGTPFLKTFIRTGNLSSAGQLVFALTNSLTLAKKFSDSLQKEEVLSAELTEINTHLDDLVLQRTKELEELNKKVEEQKKELEQANRSLKKLTLMDPLTELWNRRKYNKALEREWRRCLRSKSPLSLILMDLDHFKEFNDFYGHKAGDECLVKISGILKDSLSSSAIAARYGGEEFIILLPDTKKNDALKIAEMLREKVESQMIPHRKSSASPYVTISIGVTSTIPDRNSSYEELFKLADRALYQAKGAGRNRVVFAPWWDQ
ncbi:MAG: diguanylate cyclase [Desulfitobacterium sp.]|nr:diguanylate cyclase [Desulfitobacterium sp.]